MTVTRFNEFAAAARDRDFGRGDSAYDRYYGDPRLTTPNLAPLARPPVYAVKIVPGGATIGLAMTFGHIAARDVAAGTE